MTAKDHLIDGTPEEKVNAWLQVVRDDEGHVKAGDWMTALLPYLTLSSTNPSAPHPSITLAFTVQPEHCNRLQNLHGGCCATLFDFSTTLPLLLVNRPGFWQFLGVSRSLNVTYLRPVPAGTEVLLHCEIVSLGKRMASLRGTMKKKSDGSILATCAHDKVTIDPGTKL